MNWNYSVIWSSLIPLFKALIDNILLSLSSIALGTVLGILLGTLSIISVRFLAVLSRIFIEVFLALPTLVLLVWLYYSLPLIFPGFIISGKNCAILGLSLSLSAFVAEIVKGSINSIPLGEVEAAYCTGMSRWQTLRYILIPQIFQKSWLPLMGQYITTYKFSTLTSIIAVPEILHTANSIIAQTYRPLEVYSIVAVLFVISIVPLNVLLGRMQKVKELGGIERI